MDFLRGTAQFLATLSCSLFAGAALYINLVEHPARMVCGTETAATEFVSSYRRATVMQASLTVSSSVFSIAAWLVGGSGLWLLGGILIGAVVPFTFVAIVPTNKQLLDPALDRKSDRTRQLLSQWERLHAVRSLLSFLALIIFLYVLGVDRAAQMQTGAKKRLRRPMQRRPSEGPLRLFFSRGLMFCFLCALSSPLAFARTPERPQAKSRDPRVEEGYVTADDGVRLYYAKVGSGPQTVILPGRLFIFNDFQRLAKGRTLIFYDMRNRGRSDAVTDTSKITIHDDVKDLEAVRRLFRADKPDLIGFSYLGMMVILYATQHPDHVNRIVQIGPVSRKFGTTFPPALTAGEESKVPDPAEVQKLEESYKNGFAREHPKEYCEMEWKTEQRRMVGNPANAGRIPSPCEMRNEWPINLFRHFQFAVASVQAPQIPKEAIAKLNMPVLTIHGTKDRNAPYGGGREWAMLLPNARLITIPGAAHMSWVEAPDVIILSIDIFLSGKWPEKAEKITSLTVPAQK